MLRITGGQYKGRRIDAPAGLRARPTSSKVRQAVFNILRDRIEFSCVLDVCAGSGIMGLEALSRGADAVTFVEKDRHALAGIEESLRKIESRGKPVAGDCKRILASMQPSSFHIIFADPPYTSDLAAQIISLVDEHRLLKDGGVLVVEHSRRSALPQQQGTLTLLSARTYGQTCLAIYGHAKGGQRAR